MKQYQKLKLTTKKRPLEKFTSVANNPQFNSTFMFFHFKLMLYKLFQPLTNN